jgi:hypothetical protein
MERLTGRLTTASRTWSVAIVGIVGCSLLLSVGAARADTLQLALPIDCMPGKTCFVQNYVDVDPGPSARDFTCGSATFDGHKGVDIRVLSLEAAQTGVTVLAAAPGIVKALRDGMPDRLVRSEADRAAVRDRECGNGVVLDHGAGWETQYCHMRQGSIAVAKGQQVAAGTPLGAVGWSGLTQFAHVHLEVRRQGVVVDPFTGAGIDGTCTADGQTALNTALWVPDVMTGLGPPATTIIETGFAGGPVKPDVLENGRSSMPPVTPEAAALVFFARLINLREGDRLRFDVQGLDGFSVQSTTEPIDRNKATFVAFAGKQRRGPAWPAGVYTGKVEVLRNGAVIATNEGTHELAR